MSRPLLLIICDFLLLSLLAMARFDLPHEEAAEEPPEAEVAVEQSGADIDLIEVLRLSLESEQESRREMALQLAERQTALAEREESLQQTEQERAELASRAERTAEELERVQREHENRRAELETAIAQREREAERMREEAAAVRERARMLQERLQERELQLDRAAEERRELEEARVALLREREAIETDLRIREAEKGILQENLRAARAEIDTVRVEKEQLMHQTDRLTAGVTQLAERSGAIQDEIRQSTPLSPHTIYQSFRENRIHLRFRAVHQRLLGNAEIDYETHGVFVSDGREVYALFSNADTPFAASDLRFLLAVGGTMTVGEQSYEVLEVNYLDADPRILAVRVPLEIAENAGLAAFPLAEDPLRFPEAVLVGRRDRGYGEASFQLNSQHDGYLAMERRFFRALSGEFSPNRGDLVFSKTGEFMGVMVDGAHSAIVGDPAELGTLQIGESFVRERAQEMRGILERRLNRVPQ